MTEFLPAGECIEPFLTSYNQSPESQDSLEKLYTTITEGKKKKFICSFSDCQKVFRFKSEIERHVSAHSELKPHVCSFEKCRKSFKRLDALENHVRSQHTGEAPLTCPYPDCGLTFTTNAKLRYHIVLHGGDRPYKCSIPGCDRTFVTHSQLKQHERSVLVHQKIKVTPLPHEVSPYGASPVVFEGVNALDCESPSKKVKQDPVIGNCENFMFMGDVSSQFFLDEASKFENQCTDEQDNYDRSYELKEQVLKNVLDENETLKDRLDASEKLLTAMKQHMEQMALFAPQDFQQVIVPPEWSPNAFLDNTAVGGAEISNLSLTKDVDSYFFENDNAKLEIASADYPTRANSFEDKSFDEREDDFFANFSFENFASFPLK